MRKRFAALTIALCAAATVAIAQQATKTTPAAQVTGAARVSSIAKDSAKTARTAAITASISSAPTVQVSSEPVTGASPSALLAANSSQNAVRMLPAQDVITDDDLRAMRSGVAINYLWTETKVPPSVNPAFCDRDCEAEARAAAGMARSPNREWQAQFTAARIDLAADQQWRAAYIDGLQKAQQYCVFRRQQINPLANKPGSDATGEGEEYVGGMNEVLGEGMDSAAAQVQQEIGQVERIDSVRAAMMEVLAERAFNQCASSSHH